MRHLLAGALLFCPSLVGPTYAGPLMFTLTGTFGSVSSSGDGNVPFVGNTFQLVFTIPSSTPPPDFSIPGISTYIPTTSALLAYTNHGLTVTGSYGFGVGTSDVVFGAPSPSFPNGGLEFEAIGMYVPGVDDLFGVFAGPQLFSGTTSVPLFTPGTYLLSETSNNTVDNASFFYNDGTGHGAAEVHINGNATLVVTAVPEPNTMILMVIGLGLLWYARQRCVPAA